MPIILIIMGLLLVVLNYRALKKDDRSFSNILENKKEGISDIELEIGKVRKDMAESLLELQQEISNLKNTENNQGKINKVNGKDFDNKNKEINKKDLFIDNDNGVINEIHIKSKSAQIKELLDLGLSDEEICEKLSLGKGEVQLVKGLYKK